MNKCPERNCKACNHPCFDVAKTVLVGFTIDGKHHRSKHVTTNVSWWNNEPQKVVDVLRKFYQEILGAEVDYIRLIETSEVALLGN